ncbi:MAG: restriction endonuclease [Methylococcales bacterium]|nr:restriction endonuclease [Methylococcales bacterium]
MGIWVLLFVFVIAISILGALIGKKGRKKQLISKQSQGVPKNKEALAIVRRSEKKPIDNEAERFRRPRQAVKYAEHVEFTHWDIAFLRSLEWKRYEDICMEYLRIKNCDANVTSIGADGGIDIKVYDKNGHLILIGQCKAWQKAIGVSLVRELYGVMASERVKHGVFLTTSIFSQDAVQFAQNKTMMLIDGSELVKLINNLDDVSKKSISKIATEGDYTTPTCVNCNQKMVKRVSKKDTTVRREFWGCINYPKCKNMMYAKNLIR